MEASFNLRKRRKECGFTLEDIAKMLGVTKSTVQKWENGTISSMKSDKILPLAKVLKVSPMAILERTSDTSRKDNTTVMYHRGGVPVCETLSPEAFEYLTQTIELLKAQHSK